MAEHPYIIQNNNIVIMMNNNVYNVNRTHIAFYKILDALRVSDWDAIETFLEPKKILVEYGTGNLSIHGEKVFWKERELNKGLCFRIIKMYQEGFSIEPMVKFIDNLMENPSSTAVEELYIFLEHNTLPITSDGYFLAYKKVTANYKDCYTNTIDNSIGAIVNMERNLVDDNRNKHCSQGLHFCSIEYLTHFHGDKIMILKINPKNVVSIPKDYNNSKGRCCEYEVIGELGVSPEEAFNSVVQDIIK